MLPVRWLRLLLGGLMRALGWSVVRAWSDARDELAAVADVHLHPGRLSRARRARRDQVTATSREVRPLLAPFWMPLRHLSDFFIDLGRAVGAVTGDFLRSKAGPGGHASLGHRMAASPSWWSFVAVTVLAMVAAHSLLTGDPLHGGALLAAPDSVGHWWSTWSQTWHWTGLGSNQPGPAYLLPMAALGTLLLGQPSAVVWLLFIATAPLAFLGADRFLRRLLRGRWAPAWGGLAYAALPIVSGAVSQGRLGTVAASVLLPWAAAPALQLLDPVAEVRTRATWRVALGAALVVLFVPTSFVLVVALVLVALAARLGLRGWQVIALLVAPLLVLSPWLVAALLHPGALLTEAGVAGAVPVHPDAWQLLAGRSGGPGNAPTWWGLAVPIAALVAFWRADTRGRVARAWVVAALGAVVLAALAHSTVSLPGLSQAIRPWAGFWVVLVQAALVVAVALAADGLVEVVSTRSFGVGHVLAALAGVAVLGSLVLGGAWWVGRGIDQPLTRGSVAVAPAYMGELADSRVVLTLSVGN